MDKQKDELIAMHIDSAISACFDMASRITHMKTASPETDEGRNQLLSDLNKIIDIQKTMLIDLKRLNVLI